MGISKTTNGKFRVFVSVKGRGRKSKVVDTHDEALTTEEKLRGLLIDGLRCSLRSQYDHK